MLRLLILVLICPTVFGNAINKYKFFKDFDKHDNRIVGGEEASIQDAPYQVALLRISPTYRLVCGGTIITPNVLLSAAHCIYDTTPNEWRARVGSSQALTGGQVLEIKQTIAHELYLSNITYPFEYDISLFITFDRIDLTSPMVSLVTLPAQDQPVADGTIGLITGWGATTEGGSIVGTLRKARIPVVNQQTCFDTYGELVSDTMLCLGDLDNGGLGPCGGDSGGPFAIDGVIFGITSWGVGCARPLYPGVFTRVPSFRVWIDNNISNDDEK